MSWELGVMDHYSGLKAGAGRSGTLKPEVREIQKTGVARESYEAGYTVKVQSCAV